MYKGERYEAEYQEGLEAAREDIRRRGLDWARAMARSFGRDAGDPGFAPGYWKGIREHTETQYPALTEPHHPRDDADDTDRGV